MHAHSQHHVLGDKTLTIIKVELVKVHALDEVAESLRLEASQLRVHELPAMRRTESVATAECRHN